VTGTGYSEKVVKLVKKGERILGAASKRVTNDEKSDLTHEDLESDGVFVVLVVELKKLITRKTKIGQRLFH
jgi:magnesium-transporting ATPase (P-type)